MSQWLSNDRLSIADVAMAPYVNRLAALAMSGVWENGRLPRVTDWFVRLRQRPTFNAAFIEWMPQALSDEMYRNGLQSWPDVKALLEANQ